VTSSLAALKASDSGDSRAIEWLTIERRKKKLETETKFMKLAIVVGVSIIFPTLGMEAQQTVPGNSFQQNEVQATPALDGGIEIDLAPLPLARLPVIQLPVPQTPETSQDLNEEQLSKLLFDRRSKLPDGPNPKISERENSMCPAGVGNSCALLGGRVYYPDLIGLTYHNKTWWEAMKNPGMIAASVALIGATVLDIEGSQACIDKHTCREANPLMRGSRAEKYAVAMPINAFVIWAGVREKQHGRAILPIAIMWTTSLVHMYFGVGGLYQARTH
jgi:hypothetical protein